MIISKFKNNIINYKRITANAKNIRILFACLSTTVTFMYNIFSQVHILLIVAQCGEQTQFGIVLNTKGYRSVTTITLVT